MLEIKKHQHVVGATWFDQHRKWAVFTDRRNLIFTVS